MEQQIRKLPVSYPILTSAVIAALQNCESSATRLETSRAESFTEEPCPKSNNLAMPLVRTRETTISPCVGLPPSLTCVLEKKGTTAVRLYTAVLRVLEEKGTTAVLLYTAVLL